jgi:hypothetical protein
MASSPGEILDVIGNEGLIGEMSKPIESFVLTPDFNLSFNRNDEARPKEGRSQRLAQGPKRKLESSR